MTRSSLAARLMTAESGRAPPDAGLASRSPKTVKKNQNVLEPILAVIGARKLRELTADEVRQALAAMAGGTPPRR
jgi:hypothetical protein